MAEDWMALAETFKQEPIIAKLLALLVKPQFKLDVDSIARELPTYISSTHPSVKEEDDLLALDDALKRTQGYRDRVTEIVLQLENISRELGKMYSVAESHLAKKSEFMGLRSLDMRVAIINDVIKPIVEAIADVKSLQNSCELVTTNLKASYNTMYTQHEVMKTRLYRDRPLRKDAGTTL
jgi:hypothetical protein